MPDPAISASVRVGRPGYSIKGRRLYGDTPLKGSKGARGGRLDRPGPPVIGVHGKGKKRRFQPFAVTGWNRWSMHERLYTEIALEAA